MPSCTDTCLADRAPAPVGLSKTTQFALLTLVPVKSSENARENGESVAATAAVVCSTGAEAAATTTAQAAASRLGSRSRRPPARGGGGGGIFMPPLVGGDRRNFRLC